MIASLIRDILRSVIDVSTSHTPEDGTHSPSWPNGLTLIINIVIIRDYVLKSTSRSEIKDSKAKSNI